MSLEQQIKDKALALGFDAVGITDASPVGPEHVARFEAWLCSGCAGRMEYMHRNLDKRLHPARLCPGVRSVIVVALNYKPAAPIADCGSRIADSKSDGNSPNRQPPIRNPQSAIPNRVGRVAMYAQYEDYHPFIKALLRELADFINGRTGQQCRHKICVDSAPLAEKALAVRAGLGSIGRNHLLIHPQLGPSLLLGELLTDVPLAPDRPTEGTCAGCTRCVEACPTGALRPDGLLDATRCISYRTQYESQEEGNQGMMERWNNGTMERTSDANPPSLRSTGPLFRPPVPDSAHRCGGAGDWLFGCDECLLACPFYQRAPIGTNRQLRFHTDRAEMNLHDVLALTPAAFEAQFHDSPLRRLGLERLKSNARVCYGAKKMSVSQEGSSQPQSSEPERRP